jgi:hypothetical protein
MFTIPNTSHADASCHTSLLHIQQHNRASLQHFVRTHTLEPITETSLDSVYAPVMAVYYWSSQDWRACAASLFSRTRSRQSAEHGRTAGCIGIQVSTRRSWLRSCKPAVPGGAVGLPTGLLRGKGEVGPSERVVRLFTNVVTSDQTLVPLHQAHSSH